MMEFNEFKRAEYYLKRLQEVCIANCHEEKFRWQWKGHGLIQTDYETYLYIEGSPELYYINLNKDDIIYINTDVKGEDNKN